MYDDILKKFYLPVITAWLNSESPLLGIMNSTVERQEERTKKYYRDIPWWRRLLGLVVCPRYGMKLMKSLDPGRIWYCKSCKSVLYHKEGGRRYGKG